MLLDEIRQATGLSTYDVSKSEVIVADHPLSDYTKVNVTYTENNKVETGIDAAYVVPVSTVPTITISISVLANSEDEQFLESLNDYTESNGGYFQIVINNGTRFAGTYSSFFLKGNVELDIDVDPQDTVFTFNAVREDKGAAYGLNTPNLVNYSLTGENN